MRLKYLPKRALVALLFQLGALSSGGAQEAPAKWFEDFERKFPSVGRNAAAEDLERLSLALGLDCRGESGDEHPTKEDLDAFQQAALGTWLDAQVKASDDSIGSPPPRSAAFLEKRQAAVWRIVMLLEREVPEWGFDAREQPRDHPELILVARLSRILLSAALVEERAGRHAYASHLLEACWSLYRSVASQPELISQLIATAVLKLQAGALRKMSEPAFEWSDRLSGSAPLERLLEALRSELLIPRLRREEQSLDSAGKALLRGWSAVADRLKNLSACDISKLSSEEIWKPATEEFRKWKEETGDAELEVIGEISMPNLTNALHRVTRLMVERELTAKLLELRHERAASRTNQWPAKFYDTDSRVCPGAAYEYKPRGAAMSLRFTGPVAEPGAPALALPLSFEARAPRPTPTPTRSPRPTATPTVHP